MNDEEDNITLSPDGEARRDAMLGELIGSMRRVHRRRRTRRAALASACMIALMTGLTALVLISQSPQTPLPPMAHDRPSPTPAASFRLVTTDPGVLDRYAVRVTTGVPMLDDDALIAELAAIDRPTGLVRSGGQVWLTNDVVDSRAGEAPPPSPAF